MSSQQDRRHFLQITATTGVALGAGEWAALLPLSPVHAVDAAVTPDIVRFSPDIEPIVRLVEDTPRDKRVPTMIEQLRGGLPYRRFLAALFLAGVRKQNAHHEVYRIHAAHQMSLDARPEERLLPLFWALDRDPAPPNVNNIREDLPPAEKASAEFQDAMEKFDATRAERALLAHVRGEGAESTMQRLWHYAARDSSFIGHRAIAVANSHRSLATIGWQHAEPVLRFVVRQLLNSTTRPDAHYKPNLERVRKGIKKLTPGWAAHQGESAGTLELFGVMRDGNVGAACDLAAAQLTTGKVPAGAVWDAVHLAAADFMIRFRHGGYNQGNGLVTYALHANTSANALHHAFRACTDPETRCLILLQATAWVTDFTREQGSRKNLRDLKVTELAGAKLPESAAAAVEEIFGLLPARAFQQKIDDRTGQDEAARKTFALAQKNPQAQLLMQTARSMLFQKATTDAHDYKYPVAMFEDCEWVSPIWRPHLLAASIHWLHGTKSKDSEVIQQARAEIKKLQ